LRFPKERRTEQALQAQNFFSDDVLFVEQTYARFSRKQEGNPHNKGHNWTGPWMQNCMISPSDPVFWPFHAGFDRQWAKWQRLGGRLQPDGSNESFAPNDAYDDAAPGCNTNPSSCMAIGHHLKDTMWPWNSAVGPGASIKGNRPPANLSQGFTGPFPKAAMDGLWPSQPAIPTPGDVIDYAGTTPQRLDMGFAYDDVPFGAEPQQAIAMTTSTPGPVSVQASSTAPANARVAENESAQTDPEARAALAIATDKTKPDAQRIEALQTLSPLPDRAVTPAAIAVLDEAGRSAALGAAAIETLSLQMMFGEFDHTSHHAAMDALHKALSDKDIEVRQSALRMLASHRDPVLIDKLASSLNNSADKSFATIDAIRGLAVAGGAEKHAASIRKHIAAGQNDVRAAAIVALAPDTASKQAVAAILADRNQPEIVRSAAIRNLATGNSEATGSLIDVLKNPLEVQSLREQAATALAATVETHGAALSKTRLNGIADELRKVGPSFTPAVERALKATDALNEKK
jgi:Common central domain of tyrosinase